MIFPLLILCFARLGIALSIEEGSSRTQGLAAPNGVSNLIPTLSWRLSGDVREDLQGAYQVQAASSRQGLYSPDLWDSGKITGPNISTLHSVDALTSRDIVYWRVRAWDQSNRACKWSEPSTFEIGLVEATDWSAQWITNSAYALGKTSLPLFARQFHVACPATKARLYALGLGMQSVLVNGNEVTDEVLAPGYSNFNKTLIYTTYNISQQLHQGINAVGIELGRGEWNTEKALGAGT